MTVTDRVETPTDNLVRALVAGDAATLRADGDGDGRTLFGHFSVTNQWTDIDSVWEGTFRERIAPGAFLRTFAERRDQIKVLYDHGHDPQLGNKPLGPIVDLREDETGAYYEVSLIRTSYNDDFVIPAAQAGLLGASFRFKVVAEEWVDPKTATKANPAKLPERTITDLDLYEFGPVTFPAYDNASSGIRSMTDTYLDRLTHDPLFLARYTDRVGLAAVERLLATLPPSAEQTETVPPPTEQHTTEVESDEGRQAASGYTPTIRPRRPLEVLREERQALEARVAAAITGGRPT
jgi:hypothetical protein